MQRIPIPEIGGSNPSGRARKEAPFVYRTKGASFQLNPPWCVGEISYADEISCGDEIRLDGGRVDLISSAKQISSEYPRISSRFGRFHWK